MNSDRTKSAQDVRAALEQARVLLLEPTSRNIDLCCMPLSRAAALLKAMPERKIFRLEIEAIARLLESAAAFHTGLFQKMNGASDSAGNAAERATAPPRIRVSG